MRMNIKNNFFSDTRIAGFLYLGLALTGFFVFVFIKSHIYVSGNAPVTNLQLLEKETLARIGIAAELVMVIFQALLALWFYKIFNKVNSFASVMVATFGMVNAVMILASSAMWLSALNASLAGDSTAMVYNLFSLHESIWIVATIFFGLWLLPMGYLLSHVMKSTTLGKLLYGGTAGYIISALIAVLCPSQVVLAGVLVLPATVAEFWVIGYLLTRNEKVTKEQ